MQRKRVWYVYDRGQITTAILASFWFAWVLVAAVAIYLVWTTPSAGHSWYPPECCSGIDCAPVSEAIRHEDGTYTVTTPHGTARTDKTTKMRTSPDGRIHACLVDPNAWPGGPMSTGSGVWVRCIFLPGAV